MKKKKKIEEMETTQAHYDNKGEWSFFVNDERVTQEVYVQIMNDHVAWCKEQEELAAKAKEEVTPTKKRRKK